MNKNKLFIVLRSTALIAILVLLFIAPVFAEIISPLKKDKLSNPKFQSVVFGRIRVVNKFKDFKSEGQNYILKCQRFGDSKTFSLPISIKTLTHRWKQGYDVWGYDSPFAAESEPGNYLFGTFTYNFANFDVKTLSGDSGEAGYLNHLTVLLLRQCNIPPDSLVYLGVIEVTFDNFTLTGGRHFNFDHSIQINNDYDNDLETFRKTNPLLYERFKDNVVTAEWEEFNPDQE